MRRAAAVGLLCAVVATPSPNRATFGAVPSFDCGRAAAPIERLVCSSDSLAALDTQLATAFRERREGQDEAARASLLQDQRRWLQSRFTTCRVPTQGEIPPEQRQAAEHCLNDLYGARITALKAAPTAGASSNAPARLDKTLFAAKGKNETLATVTTFGRYSIAAKSEQGTAIQLIDRMAGPGIVEGSAGHGDGRIDAFLDRGQYKIKLVSDARGSGDVELSVVPFFELNPDPQQLVELKPVAAELGDIEQRSYWLDVKERRFVAIEAAGRYLADLRLWKDGNWLVDADPTAGERDPTGGEPLAIRQLSLWLEPGLYRLVAYGGAGEKWSSGATGKPFYLRYGIPRLPDAGRALHVASPFGVDRWIVPGSASYFRIDIDNPEHATVSAQPYEQEHPFATGGDRAAIEKNSRDPKAEISTSGLSSDRSWLVTIERKPGEKYRLQYFDDRRERRLDFDGASADYWLATLQAGNGVDALDPTALVVRNGHDIVAASTVELDPAKAWHRKFNLLDTITLFLHADQPIDLVAEGTGADAEYRIEPFLTNRPSDYRTPPTKTSGGAWSIDKGYSVLTISPREGGKGILDLTLRPAKGGTDEPEQPRLAAPVFPKIGIEQNHDYTLYLNATGERYGGAALHRLPVDLGDGASFEIGGGASLAIPVAVPESGKLEADTDDGKPVALAIDGKAATEGLLVEAGKHDLSLIAPATGGPSFISLAFTPTPLLQATPLPPVDQARLAAARPNFPMLIPGKPAFLDLAHDERTTFDVSVDKPALYRLETSGIIETAGAIRTRIVPSLDEQSANGVGRNFLIQQYLREGDYQLTARPAGESFGAIGVSVAATPVADLGALEEDLWARATLHPGEAGRYRFHVADAGDYRIHTLGLGHEFMMRLDDSDGWPLLKPGSTADQTISLDPGDYQMVLLPQSVESRAVTLLQRVKQPIELSGHGPFALSFGSAMRNRWMEPEKGAERVPDRWTFSLPAEAEVTIAVDNGMQATLVAQGKATDNVALAERSWTGKLEAGDYAVDVVSAAPNNRVDYGLTVSTTELLTGQQRSIVAPARLPISIGADRQVELASFGGEDVKARLYDADGKLVAANDDRENDWNFLIPARLKPGRYELQVDPVGTKSASAEIALAQPEETEESAIAFGKALTIGDGKIHVVPLPETHPDSLILLTARAAAPVGLSIETKEGDGSWRTLGSTSGADPYLALPRGASGGSYRARIWAIDHGHVPIEFRALAPIPTTVSESTLVGHGVSLPTVDDAAGLGAVAVSLDQPGALQLGPGDETVRWSGVADTVADRDASGTIIASATKLWLVDKADRKHPPIVSAHRIDPNGSEPIHLVVRGSTPLLLPLAAKNKDGPILWQVDGQGGQPGISITDMNAAKGGEPPLMAVGPDSPTLGSAVAISSGASPRPALAIWNAGGSGEEMPTTLRHSAFGAPKAQTVSLGINDGVFGGHEAQVAALPKGYKRLTLILPTGTVAILMREGVPNRMIWSVSSRADIVDTAADQLLLLHPSDDAAPYSITAESADGEEPAELASGAILSRYSPTPGILHIKLAAGAGQILRVAGGAKAATILTPDGRVRRGTEIAAATGGFAGIEYQAGLFAIGIDAPSADTAKAPTMIAPPATVSLAGSHMDLRVAPSGERLVHVASDTPIVLRANGGGNRGRTLFAEGADLNLLAAKDRPLDLAIDPAGAAALSGAIHFASVDLTPIGEGLGPKRRLAPGQSRAFSFSIPDKRTVGVGVRASVDVATCRLLRADGTEIGRGLVHMHELDAGTYVLVVDAPVDGPAIDIEPALVGSVLPDRGPPDSVKADYLLLVGKQAKK